MKSQSGFIFTTKNGRLHRPGWCSKIWVNLTHWKGIGRFPCQLATQKFRRLYNPTDVWVHSDEFWLWNGPATFQCLMNMVVSGLEGFTVYLDDTVIFNGTRKSHVQCIHARWTAWHRQALLSCHRNQMKLTKLFVTSTKILIRINETIQK